MIRWLHRNIFRGIGWIMLIGVITGLYLFLVNVHK